MHHYQHILAPIDFSHDNNAIIERARELTEHYDARLTLLHVVEDVPLGTEPFGEPSSLILNEELRQQQLRHATTQMQVLAERFALPFNVEQAIEEGFITSTILAFAQHKQVDLIVIAHSGKKGFLGLLGSTANAVVKSADCDVLIIKPRHP